MAIGRGMLFWTLAKCHLVLVLGLSVARTSTNNRWILEILMGSEVLTTLYPFCHPDLKSAKTRPVLSHHPLSWAQNFSGFGCFWGSCRSTAVSVELRAQKVPPSFFKVNLDKFKDSFQHCSISSPTHLDYPLVI